MTEVSKRATVMSGRMAVERAVEEYDRFVDLLRGLDRDDWARPTDCAAWDVRTVAVHVLAVAERSATIWRNIATFAVATPVAKRRGIPTVDLVNEREVAARDRMTPASIVSGIEHAAPRALRRRATLPKLVGRVRVSTTTGREQLRYLYDVVFTRDTWMHRIDIFRAVGRDLTLTASHDGCLVADLVADWSDRHTSRLTLVLTGPAGGVFQVNGGGPEHHVDAIEFARFLSGRTQLPLPDGPVMF